MKDVLDDFPNLHEESTNGIGITTAGCKDTGTKKKCKKCNTKKCKKGYCKSKCQKTCGVCKGKLFLFGYVLSIGLFQAQMRPNHQGCHILSD